MMRNDSSKPFRPGAFRTMLLAFAGAALLCAGAPALAKTKPKPDAASAADKADKKDAKKGAGKP
jgi:hypothetical protein